MRVYFLVRDSVPMAHARVAAHRRTDLPELAAWLTGSAEVQYCLVNDQEFEWAKRYRNAIVLSSELHEGKEVAIAFGPRNEWPDEFGWFRDFFAEAERRREERENITEEKWLGWDTHPIDLANFALRRASERKIRLFAVACCDLVAHRTVDSRSRRAVKVALRHADGTASDQELIEAHDDAMMASRRLGGTGQTSPEYGAAALAMNATGPFDRTPTPDMPDGWLSLCVRGQPAIFSSGTLCRLRTTIPPSRRR